MYRIVAFAPDGHACLGSYQAYEGNLGIKSVGTHVHSCTHLYYNLVGVFPFPLSLSVNLPPPQKNTPKQPSAPFFILPTPPTSPSASSTTPTHTPPPLIHPPPLLQFQQPSAPSAPSRSCHGASNSAAVVGPRWPLLPLLVGTLPPTTRPWGVGTRAAASRPAAPLLCLS